MTSRELLGPALELIADAATKNGVTFPTQKLWKACYNFMAQRGVPLDQASRVTFILDQIGTPR